MKLMFASDIHGSALYCEKMLEAYSREAPSGSACWGISSTTDRATTFPKGTRRKRSSQC